MNPTYTVHRPREYRHQLRVLPDEDMLGTYVHVRLSLAELDLIRTALGAIAYDPAALDLLSDFEDLP